MTERRVAIIGGGASCVLILAHLAWREAKNIRIDVYDRAGRFGRGIAYSTGYDQHCLNVRAANMSAFQEGRDDFAIWAAADGDYAPDDFVPRPVYAKYLDQVLKNAQKALPVQFIKQDVTGCRKQGDHYNVSTASGDEIYDDVILATGNVRAIQLPVEGEMDHYSLDPFQIETYQSLPKGGTVALLGSGLSAIDAITSLKQHKYNGKILVISRNGWLPQSHARPAKYLCTIEPERFSLPPSAMMKILRDHVRDAAKGGLSWQAVMDDAMRPITNDIWQAWPDRYRKIFMRHAMALWGVHRHRMSDAAARSVSYYKEAGQLAHVRDKIIHLEGPDKIVCKGQTYRADAIINCLGYKYDEGRDFAVSYKIGPPSFGDLFETTAIPEIRAQADSIARALTT